MSNCYHGKTLICFVQRFFKGSLWAQLVLIYRWYLGDIQHISIRGFNIWDDWTTYIQLAIWHMKQLHCQLFFALDFSPTKAKCKGCTHSVSVSIAPCIFGCCLLWSPMRRSCTLHSAFLWCMDLKSQRRREIFPWNFWYTWSQSWETVWKVKDGLMFCYRNHPRRSWLALQTYCLDSVLRPLSCHSAHDTKSFLRWRFPFWQDKSKLNHWSNKIHPGEDGDRFQSWTKNPYVSTTTYLLGAATTQPYTWQLPF